MSEDETAPGVEGVVTEDGDGYKPMRTSLANGTVEGREYQVTQDMSSGAVLVEFESGPYVTYHLPQFVRDAYERVFEDEFEDDGPDLLERAERAGDESEANQAAPGVPTLETEDTEDEVEAEAYEAFGEGVDAFESDGGEDA